MPSRIVDSMSDQALLMRLLACWNAFQNGAAPYPFELTVGADSVEAETSIVVGAETLSEADVALINAILASADEINALASSGITNADLVKLHAITASADEINVLDGVTAGVVTASKAMVVDANKDIGTVRYFYAEGVQAGSVGVGGVAGTVAICDGLNPGSAVTLTYSDVLAIDGITPGTLQASRAIVVNAQAHINEIATAALWLGASGATTQVTSTAAELNYLDLATGAGTAEANKAVVVDSNKRIDTLVIGTLKLGAGAGTTVTSDASELNVLDGIAAAITVGTHNSHHTFISGITADTDEINKLDGLATSKAELGTLASSGITNADLIKLHAITADKDEINKLDGCNISKAELNSLASMPITNSNFFDWTVWPSMGTTNPYEGGYYVYCAKSYHLSSMWYGADASYDSGFIADILDQLDALMAALKTLGLISTS